MNIAQLLAANLKSAHDAFKQTVADVTPEMASWIPQGIAHPIGERYAHLVAAEDMLVNGVERGQTPWFMSTWAGKAGFEGLNLQGTLEQARAVRVDLQPLREYMHALFAETEAYFAGLNDEDLRREVDMTMVGYGKLPFPIWASEFVIGHVHDLMGEISALKGLLGAKGYPY